MLDVGFGCWMLDVRDGEVSSAKIGVSGSMGVFRCGNPRGEKNKSYSLEPT